MLGLTGGGLKGLLDKKRKAAEEEFGNSTSAKRAQIESVRQQRLREEEQAELQQQVLSYPWTRGFAPYSALQSALSSSPRNPKPSVVQAERRRAAEGATTSDRRESLQVVAVPCSNSAIPPQLHRSTTCIIPSHGPP